MWTATTGENSTHTSSLMQWRIPTLAVYSFKIQLFFHTINFSVFTLYKYIYNIYHVNMDGLVRHHEMHPILMMRAADWTGSINPGKGELLSSLGFVVSVARCTKPQYIQYFSSSFIGLIRNLEWWRMPTNAAHFTQSNVVHPVHPY